MRKKFFIFLFLINPSISEAETYNSIKVSKECDIYESINSEITVTKAKKMMFLN